VKKSIVTIKGNTAVNQVRVWMSASHLLSATLPAFPGVRSRFSSVQLRKLFKRKKACIVKKHKWSSDACIVHGFCRTKEEMLDPYPSGHCLLYTIVFDQSNSAPGRLKNV